VKINRSSDITKLFDEIIVTKDKVSKIVKFYENIEENIKNDFDEILIKLESDKAWMRNLVDAINFRYSELVEKIGDFAGNTTDSESMVGHSKYLEMMALYNTYINAFYDRMNELYELYKQQFITSKMSKINDTWKFHYSENRTDASRIKSIYSSINITRNSEVIELSNNHYLVFNNDNAVYDINYKTRDCYIVNLDSKTLRNSLNILQGSQANIYSGENAVIRTISQVNGKDRIYILIDLGLVYNPEVYSDSDMLGNANDGAPHIITIAHYDTMKKAIILPLPTDKTSTLIIADNLLNNNKIKIFRDSYNEFYYLG
jgi:hypothetical protein